MKAFPLHETKMRKSSPREEQSTHKKSLLVPRAHTTRVNRLGAAVLLGHTHIAPQVAPSTPAGVNPWGICSGLQSSAQSRIVALLHCTWRMKTKARLLYLFFLDGLYLVLLIVQRGGHVASLLLAVPTRFLHSNTLGAKSTYRWWLSWDEGSFVRALSSKNYFPPPRETDPEQCIKSLKATAP